MLVHSLGFSLALAATALTLPINWKDTSVATNSGDTYSDRGGSTCAGSVYSSGTRHSISIPTIGGGRGTLLDVLSANANDRTHHGDSSISQITNLVKAENTSRGGDGHAEGDNVAHTVPALVDIGSDDA